MAGALLRGVRRGLCEKRVRVPTSPRGPRPREDLPPIRPDLDERQETQGTTTTAARTVEGEISPTAELHSAFRKRFQRRETVPAIVVQSPVSYSHST